MSARRPAPGRQISAGSLRVDAARAVMKLRDYQLPEPEMWILELLRAGVTLGAESIRVTGDSDDVRVSWEGGAPDVDELTTLLDELVNPVADPKRRHLRLMATAVNTGLGLRPRHVDIYVVADGGAKRVRYTPSILEVDSDDPFAGASKLRHLVAEDVPRPPMAPERGVLVHLRRFPDLGVLTTFVSGREPSELRLVRESCDDTRVPISVGDGVLEKARSDRDVLRMPLGPDIDGFMALMHVATRPDWPRPAIFEACERGVLLARHPVELFPCHQAVPIRISVDADRLPTNASRSEVRREEAPIAQAEARVPEVFAELVKRIARELGPEPELEWSDRSMNELRRSAFALLASVVGVSDVRAQLPNATVGSLGPLVEMPLLRDPFGNARSLADVAEAGRRPDYVYRGDAPLDESLREWLHDMIWVRPGEPAELLFAHTQFDDVRRRIVAAEKSLLARRRYLRYPVHEGRVREAEGQLLSIPLGDLSLRVAESNSVLAPLFFAGANLKGELCLTSEPRHATISYLYDGRLLAKRRIESKVPFEAVVSSPLLTPNESFSGLLDDEGARTVDRTLVGAAIWAAEALARRLDGERRNEGHPRQRWVRSQKKLAESEEVKAVLRGAIAAHHDLFRHSDIGGPLRSAPVFRVATEDGAARWASISDVFASGEHGSYFTVGAGAAAHPNPGIPKGRLIIAGSLDDLPYLRVQLPGGAKIVHYDQRSLASSRDAKDLATELAPLVGAAITFEREDGFGAIGMTMTVPLIDVRHCGRTLVKSSEAAPRFPCWILYEGTTLVPTPDWKGVAGGSVPRLFALEELDLLRKIVQRLVGEPVEGLFVVEELFHRQVVPLLLERLGEVGLDTALPKSLRTKFRRLALFRVVGRQEPQSLEELEALHPGSLRYVSPEHDVDFPVEGFHPLCAPERLARAVAKMLGKQARNAEKELERRKKRTLRERRLAVHRAKPPVVTTSSHGDHRIAEIEPASMMVAKVRVSFTNATGKLEILVEDRPFALRMWLDGPPVDATVHAAATAADDELLDVRDDALEAIQSMVIAAVPALLAGVARSAPDSLRTDHSARRLLDWWIDHPSESTEGSEVAAALASLGEAPLFDTVQGDRAGAAAALRRSKVYIASYVGMWLGPDEGEAPHSLDRPVLRVAAGASREIALVRNITRCDVADVTKACEQLQSRRRVAQGLVPKPTLHGISGVSHVHDVGVLVGKDRRLRAGLGPGEIGLSDLSTSRVYIRRDGRSLGSVEIAVKPTIVATLESPDVPREPAEIAGYAPLRERLQRLAGLLVEKLVDEGVERLEASERRQIRSAMLDGAVLADLEGKDELPLFETTVGIWLSKKELRAQTESFGAIWYVPDVACAEVALDPERHVFRLAHEEATNLLGDLLVLVDATEELRLDAEARRNRQRAPVERLTLDYGEDRAAMAWEILTGKGDHLIEGIVAPLRPGLAAHRGMRLSRERHPLGDHGDPCEWPTRAVIDAPRVEPNRTWSGAKEEGEAFETLRREVRRASDRALASLVKIPPGALEPRRVSAADARRAGVEYPVRGALWARSGQGSTEPVTVIDRGGSRVLRTDGHATFPIEGRLFVDGPPEVAAAEQVARVVYQRMLISLSRRVANEWDPVMAAHIIQGLATNVVKAADLPGDHAWPLGVARPLDPATVARWLSGAGGIVWYVAPDEVEAAREAFTEGEGGPTESDPWLIDDGSIAARALLMHLDWRAKRWPPAAVPGPSLVMDAVVAPPIRDVGGAPESDSDSDSESDSEWVSVAFDELVEAPAAHASLSAPVFVPPPQPDVAQRVFELLAKTFISVPVAVVPGRRRSILRRGDRAYELTARDPAVVAVQNAVDSGDPRAASALAILAARVAGEANRARDEVTNGHEIEALVTLLGTR